jgi:hypothetical protein
MSGWNERVVSALERLADAGEALAAAVSKDGERLRVLSLAESATTTTTPEPTTTTAEPTTTTTAEPTTTTTAGGD